MTGDGRFPNLVDRALAFLSCRDGATTAALCAELFGAPTIAGATGGPWSRLLGQVLGADPRFERLPDDRWTLRGRAARADSLASAELVAIAVIAAGPKPWRHPLVGIAAVRFRAGDAGQAGTLWQSAIRPEQPIRLPDYVEATGYTAAEVEAAPTFAGVADDLRAFIGDRPLVGMDVGLAAAFLQTALRQAGRSSLTNPLIDLPALVALALGGGAPSGKPDLERLAAVSKVPPPDGRRLAAQARTVARIAARSIARIAERNATTLALLVAELRGTTAGPAASLDATRRRLLLDAALAQGIPTSPGVYLFRDETGAVLYVGKATSLRQRLTTYLTSDIGRTRRMPGLVEATDEIETRPTESELEARLVEARLIAEHRPRYNVQLRAGVGMAYVCRNAEAGAKRGKGDPRRPAWASLAEAPAGECIGPLDVEAARRLIREVGERFGVAGGRRNAAWSARAESAWQCLVEAAPATPVGAGLAAADLTLFALATPWPDAARYDDFGAAGADPTLEFPGASDLGDDAEPDDPDYWPGVNQDSASDEAGEGGADDAGAPVGPRWLRDGAMRAVFCGWGGYLGGLTVSAEADPDDLAESIAALVAAAGPERATALAELGVALREAARAPERVVALAPADVGRAAVGLLALAARLRAESDAASAGGPAA